MVAGGHILAIETYGGTDWMLHSLQHKAADWPKGGVMVKAPKQGQDRRIDLPTIGPATVQAVAQAGLSGIAVEERGVMVLDLAHCIDIANASGLFLWVKARGTA